MGGIEEVEAGVGQKAGDAEGAEAGTDNADQHLFGAGARDDEAGGEDIRAVGRDTARSDVGETGRRRRKSE